MNMNVLAKSRLGGHVGYVTGGDIEEDCIGYGGQLELGVTDFLGLQISGTVFEEEAETDASGFSGDANLFVINGALSAVLRATLDPVDLYALGGVNYNYGTVDGSVDLLIVRTDIDGDVDGVGYHLGAGASLRLGDGVEIFAEYRHTMLELEGELDADSTTFLGTTISASEDIEFDYDFGMARGGINILF